MEPLRNTSAVRFGTYEVSFQSGEVRKAGVKIRVQQQPMKVLEILLERPGEVVTREELRGRVWPDESFGDFDQAVNIAIAKLRSALGDSAENPRFIELCDFSANQPGISKLPGIAKHVLAIDSQAG